jgi:flavin reductase (DIM6/NTAB) family NADH-FMN oxidoreductase RutF
MCFVYFIFQILLSKHFLEKQYQIQYKNEFVNRIGESSMAEKIKINNNVFVYPMPVTLLGANVEGKANFMALGWVSRVNANPPMIGVGVNKSHYTPRV